MSIKVFHFFFHFFFHSTSIPILRLIYFVGGIKSDIQTLIHSLGKMIISDNWNGVDACEATYRVVLLWCDAVPSNKIYFR